MTRVAGTFKVLGWEERPYDAPDLPALTHASVSQELLGDIEGEASVTYLLASREDKTTSFIGLARVVGRIREREGTFVMLDVGTKIQSGDTIVTGPDARLKLQFQDGSTMTLGETSKRA